MRKEMESMRNGITLAVCLCCLLLVACVNEKDASTDKQKVEKIVIDNFIDKQGIKVLTAYPEGGVFGEKEFVLLRNGVYLHVIDSGNGNRPVKGTKIQTLAKGKVLGDTEGRYDFDGFKSAAKPKEMSMSPTADGKKYWPQTFTYGKNNYADWSDYIGDGYMSAMDYVGDNAYVSMIIPFSAGGVFQHSRSCAMYFEKVHFTFVEE